MKLIVFGATGSIGSVFVKQALNENLQVTAFSRSPEKLGIEDINLSLISGDVENSDMVMDAIKGHDAVIIALGSGNSLFSKVRSIGTANILKGMKHHGITRVICQSTLGTHESWDNLNFYWKYIMFGGILSIIFKDHELQEDYVRDSGLDWTIVRPSAFTDGPADGNFKTGFSNHVRDLTFKISRANVANFLLSQVRDHTYLNKAVSISN